MTDEPELPRPRTEDAVLREDDERDQHERALTGDCAEQEDALEDNTLALP